MTARTETMRLATTPGHSSEISAQYRDGIVAGLIGAATISIWFLILDTLQGHPLFTPAVLGTALLHRGADPASLAGSPTPFEVVVFYTWVHGLVFCFLGGIAARLLALARGAAQRGVRHPVALRRLRVRVRRSRHAVCRRGPAPDRLAIDPGGHPPGRSGHGGVFTPSSSAFDDRAIDQLTTAPERLGGGDWFVGTLAGCCASHLVDRQWPVMLPRSDGRLV